MAIDGGIDLSQGWINHPGIPGGYILAYNDGIVNVSIVTGPKSSGLMGVIAPGVETTYEAWFPGLSDPTGYLTLENISGIIQYLRQKALEDTRENDFDSIEVWKTEL
jgi:hypothetical protein